MYKSLLYIRVLDVRLVIVVIVHFSF